MRESFRNVNKRENKLTDCLFTQSRDHFVLVQVNQQLDHPNTHPSLVVLPQPFEPQLYRTLVALLQPGCWGCILISCIGDSPATLLYDVTWAFNSNTDIIKESLWRVLVWSRSFEWSFRMKPLTAGILQRDVAKRGRWYSGSEDWSLE